MTGERRRLLNVPNALSAYRIAALPLIACAIVLDRRLLFALLIVINLVTDILDGLIARVFHQETELGAKLDSFADIGTYFSAAAGLLYFEQEFVCGRLVSFSAMLTAYLLPQCVSLVRFRRPMSMHLYSSKVSGYAQGIFFGTYFFIGFMAPLFYTMVAITIFNGFEELAVLSVLRESRSNAQGLYWVLKRRGAGRG